MGAAPKVSAPKRPDLPIVTIVLTTFLPPGHEEERLAAACEAVDSWANLLVYEGDLVLVVEEDGHGSLDVESAIDGYWPPLFTTERGMGGVGASLNRGMHFAFQRDSPIVLYAVDDWKLTERFDITPWVEGLMSNSALGCIRLGPPHPSLTGHITIISEQWQGWAFLPHRRDGGIIAAHRPALWHHRFFHAYGPWREGVSALECERDMNARYIAGGSGPVIVIALPHPWQHIDTVSLSERIPS